MPVILLDHKNQKLGVYPPHMVELLEQRPRSEEAIATLDQLHRERSRLMCECKRVLHVVQREYPFLRRNPGQNPVSVECQLCKTSRDHEMQWEGAKNARRKRPTVSFILATRNHIERSDEREKRNHSKGSRESLKYARAFGVFFNLMDGAGFTSLTSSLRWSEAWRRLHSQLKGIQLHPKSRKTLADFCWMPGGFYKGGLKDMNDRMLEWDHPEIQPEGWVFCVLAQTPESESVPVSVISEETRRKNEEDGKKVYPPYVFTIPKHNISVIGRNGPYLTLAAASVNKEGPSPYRKPIFHRLLLQSIAGECNPVPVESNYERDAVLLLQRLGIPFKKPVFDDAEGLRPDFILPKHQLIIEVQGLSSEEYRERKKETHQRLKESQTYRRFKLITYAANDGQSLIDFERGLRNTVGS